MNLISQYTPQSLRKAASVKEQILYLEKTLAALLNGENVKTPIRGLKRHALVAPQRSTGVSARSPNKPMRVKRIMSKATKAKIAAVAKARWAKARKEGRNQL